MGKNKTFSVIKNKAQKAAAKEITARLKKSAQENPLDEYSAFVEEIQSMTDSLKPKTELSEIFSSIVPPEVLNIMETRNIAPLDIPMSVTGATAASLLMDSDPSSALGSVWKEISSAAKKSVEDDKKKSEKAFSSFTQILSSLPVVHMDTSAIEAAKGAAEYFTNNPFDNSLRSQEEKAKIQRVTQIFGSSSARVYNSYLAYKDVQDMVNKTQASLQVSADVFGAAEATLNDANQISTGGFYNELQDSGIGDLGNSYAQLNGVLAFSTDYSDQCDRSLEQLTILYAATSLIDDIYKIKKNGNVDWVGLMTNFGISVVTREFLDILGHINRKPKFTAGGIMSPVSVSMDAALAAKICGERASEMISAMTRTFDGQYASAMAAAGSVATVYGLFKETQNSGFISGVSSLRKFGAGGAFNLIKTGNLKNLLTAKLPDILDVSDKISGLRELQKSASNEVVSGIIEDQINDLVSLGNVSGHMMAGSGDAPRPFSRSNDISDMLADRLKTIVKV